MNRERHDREHGDERDEARAEEAEVEHSPQPREAALNGATI
jgi:hypothetical protein